MRSLSEQLWPGSYEDCERVLGLASLLRPPLSDAERSISKEMLGCAIQELSATHWALIQASNPKHPETNDLNERLARLAAASLVLRASLDASVPMEGPSSEKLDVDQ